jgi:DNA-directed RNA polymerase subunit RPC12/RpoP
MDREECPRCGSKVKWYTKEDRLYPIGKPDNPYFICSGCGLETEMFGDIKLKEEVRL